MIPSYTRLDRTPLLSLKNRLSAFADKSEACWRYLRRNFNQLLTSSWQVKIASLPWQCSPHAWRSQPLPLKLVPCCQHLTRINPLRTLFWNPASIWVDIYLDGELCDDIVLMHFDVSSFVVSAFVCKSTFIRFRDSRDQGDRSETSSAVAH